MKNVRLVQHEINTSEMIESVKDNNLGGVVTFTGEVRSVTGSLITDKLIYESHETMALKQMEIIAGEAAARWDANVAIAHRIGELLPGEVAVVCVAACIHRADAFECCRFLIDRIKDDVPIWKKEIGNDGAAWIAGNQRIQNT